MEVYRVEMTLLGREAINCTKHSSRNIVVAESLENALHLAQKSETDLLRARFPQYNRVEISECHITVLGGLANNEEIICGW